jgi:hypothetical protein
VVVRVEMFNGTIEVKDGEPGKVTAEVKVTGVAATPGEADADRDKIAVTLDANPDGSVLLRAVYQPAPGSPDGRSASAVVEVPAGAGLDLRTSNGAVSVAGVGGAVDVRTSNGAVDLADVALGVTVRTSNGGVDVAGRGALDVETSNGRLLLRVTDGSGRAHTSNGDVTFEGSLGGAAQSLETSNGAITVTLPADASFGLDARTSNGKVALEGFTIRTTGAASGDALQGTVGSGAPSLTLRTSNGAIVVRAGD